jgi:hypothetical protein
MAVEWRIKAVHLANCNCAYGCPCKFTALPTHGNCRSVVGYEIEEGHFGAIRLDGLRAVLINSWPGGPASLPAQEDGTRKLLQIMRDACETTSSPNGAAHSALLVPSHPRRRGACSCATK